MIPPEAVKERDGKDVCYVLPPGRPEPEVREIEVGRLSANRVEVVDGLAEGDRVFLGDPSDIAVAGRLASIRPWK